MRSPLLPHAHMFKEILTAPLPSTEAINLLGQTLSTKGKSSSSPAPMGCLLSQSTIFACFECQSPLPATGGCKTCLHHHAAGLSSASSSAGGKLSFGLLELLPVDATESLGQGGTAAMRTQ